MVGLPPNTDIVVRSSVANLIVDLCMDCESKKCVELLEILEEVNYFMINNQISN